MKISGQDKEVTVNVHGRKRTFSEKELIAILEEYFPSEVTEKNGEEKVAYRPNEGEWFEVNPLAIKQELFNEEKKNTRQEETRQLILEAFDEVKSNPEKYGKKFKTMMPKKTWLSKNVGEIKEFASKIGDHNADWVEQALEWAQRIANGESWEAICNNADTASWHRLVVWKTGYPRLVGGSRRHSEHEPASHVEYNDCHSIFLDNYSTVPLVVLYEK